MKPWPLLSLPLLLIHTDATTWLKSPAAGGSWNGAGFYATSLIYSIQ